MNRFIVYICTALLISMSGVLSAQTPECITLDVTYSITKDNLPEITGEAHVSFQGNAWLTVGNGFESYCDGSSIWTVDLTAKEVYIESVTPEYESRFKEAAEKLASLKENAETLFTTDEFHAALKIKSIKKSDGKDISSFRPSQKFDSSWVVTDLR